MRVCDLYVSSLYLSIDLSNEVKFKVSLSETNDDPSSLDLSRIKTLLRVIVSHPRTIS